MHKSLGSRGAPNDHRSSHRKVDDILEHHQPEPIDPASPKKSIRLLKRLQKSNGSLTAVRLNDSHFILHNMKRFRLLAM
jgi:hypothetical protein